MSYNELLFDYYNKFIYNYVEFYYSVELFDNSFSLDYSV